MARYSTAQRQFTRGQENGPAYGVTRSMRFDIDNGAGTTIDDVVLRSDVAVTITGVRAVYTDATTGTVAAGNFKVGTTVGGGEICAATAYGNAAAIGTITAATIVSGVVAAAAAVFVRHTGVAAVAVGQAYIEVEYIET